MATTKPGGAYRGTDGKLRNAQGALIDEPVVTVETPVPATEKELTVRVREDPSLNLSTLTEPIEPAPDATPKPKSKKAK